MFEKSIILKIRFKTGSGLINTEDLWDLSLESLDSLAKSLNKSLKEATEESFIQKKTSASSTLELKFEIVKFVIKTKLEEMEKAKSATEKRAKKQLLMELIAKKEQEGLSSKSVDELQKELENLDD